MIDNETHAEAAMQHLGEINGIKWYWADIRFEKSGAWYWDGQSNVHVPTRIAELEAQVEWMSGALEEVVVQLDWQEKEAEEIYKNVTSWRNLVWGEKIIEALEDLPDTSKAVEKIDD